MRGEFLRAENVTKIHPPRRWGERPLKALAGVSVTVEKGEVLGIVGESGSGKSTLARILLGLEPPTNGRVLFRGRDISRMSAMERKAFRRRVQIVFQDPESSLNPRHRVGTLVGDGLRIHQRLPSEVRERRVGELLESVGLSRGVVKRYPHQLSGGQRQRIALARALSVSPDVLLLDEPTSALDVSVQARILRLLDRLRRANDLTYVFISHDLGVVRAFCTRIIVMREGRIVEEGETVLESPRESYTRRLLDSIPRLAADR
ncbi:MAG: ABC transporter ATP-binding protein [Candidatus Hydrogenedentota bacterium]|nr:MAG: ABC transporter ATP-binding protein [Candidatus Hydrogenedentota bacterium]